MAYNRIQAARLLSKSEMEVFASSLADRLSSLTAAKLLVMIRRTRALRDKSRDLLRRQRLETRSRTGSKGGPTGGANLRTAEKAQAFAEVLQRFEARLARVEAAEKVAARKAASARSRSTLAKKRGADAAKEAAGRRQVSPKAPAERLSPGPGPLGPTSESARAARHAMQFKASGSRAIQGHVSSLGRRNQAKRDKRR